MRWLLLTLVVAGCGRIGYDAVDVIDAPVDAIDGPVMACGAATQVIALGEAAPLGGLDLVATTTGFVAIWTSGGQVYASGLAHLDVPTGPYLVNLQTGGVIAAAGGAAAISAIGDDAMVAIARTDAIDLYPTSEVGYSRGSMVTIDGVTGTGPGFIVGDAGRDRFLVLGNTGAEVSALLRDRDGGAVAGPTVAFSVATEATAAVPTSSGYALMTGASQCDFVDANIDLGMGQRRSISSTCHHAALVAPRGAGDRMVAAWNCDNDNVWANAGTLATGWNASDTSVYVASSPAPENPRIAASADGVWYGFTVGPDQLAVALLDSDAALVPTVTPAVVHTSSTIGGYDVAAHGDQAYLFWLDNADTSLWAMRLCRP